MEKTLRNTEMIDEWHSPSNCGFLKSPGYLQCHSLFPPPDVWRLGSREINEMKPHVKGITKTSNSYRCCEVRTQQAHLHTPVPAPSDISDRRESAGLH